MVNETAAPRELLYEYTVNLTAVLDFGVTMDTIAGGKALPPEGARVDIAFAGPISGPKVNGRVSGMDYLHVRCDGRMQLHIHGVITTDDGARISLFADGVAIPRAGEPKLDLRENATLFTSDPRYTWVNGLQAWAEGEADLVAQTVAIRGYRA